MNRVSASTPATRSPSRSLDSFATRQHRSRRRARRRHHPPRRFRRRPRPRSPASRGLPRCARQAAQIEATAESHRSISQRRRKNRRPGKTPQPQRQSHSNPRRSRQQSQDVDITLPLGLLTVVTGVSGSGNPRSSTTFFIARSRKNSIALPKRPPRTANYRLRAHRQSHRDRSGTYRPHAALESRHLHPASSLQSAISLPCFRNRANAATAPAASALTSRAPLRSLPGRRPSPHRNEFSSRRLVMCEVCAAAL